MCFKVQGVMFYLVGIDSKKERGGKEQQRQESEEGGGASEVRLPRCKPSFTLHAWKAISEAAESPTTH